MAVGLSFSPHTVGLKETFMLATIVSWLMSHWDVISTVLLSLSEALALLFPSENGFGGILAGIIKSLRGMGAKDTSGK